MTVRYYSGRDALFIFNTGLYDSSGEVDGIGVQNIVKASSWNLQADMGLLSTTTLGEAYNTFIPDRVTYTGSATLLYYENDAEANGDNYTGQLMSKLYKTGTGSVTTSDEAGFKLRIRGGNNEKHDVTLNGYLTSVSIGATVGDIITAQVSFTANGALMEASMAALT